MAKTFSFEEAQQPIASGSTFSFEEALGKEKEVGGFGAALKNISGQTVKGVGQLATDYIPGVEADNAITQYGQRVVDSAPLGVNKLGDVVDKPWTAVKEAVGNALPSVATGVGLRAAGMGITAAAPLTGPFAPVTAGVGQAIAWGGPALAAALPTYSGIREAQIEKDPTNAADPVAKGIGLVGAAASGAIEQFSGPQQWATKLITKEGRGAIAKQFASKTLGQALVKGGIKGGLEEGAEELVQNPIEQLAGFGDPTTKESLFETAHGGVMGAIGGGVLGAGTGAAFRSTAKDTPAAETPPADPIEILRKNFKDDAHPLNLTGLTEIRNDPAQLQSMRVDQAQVDNIILDEFKHMPGAVEVVQSGLNAGIDPAILESMRAGLIDPSPMDAEWKQQQVDARIRNQQANPPAMTEADRLVQDYQDGKLEPVIETPVAEAPIIESPIVEAPIAETPEAPIETLPPPAEVALPPEPAPTQSANLEQSAAPIVETLIQGAPDAVNSVQPIQDRAAPAVGTGADLAPIAQDSQLTPVPEAAPVPTPQDQAVVAPEVPQPAAAVAPAGKQPWQMTRDEHSTEVPQGDYDRTLWSAYFNDQISKEEVESKALKDSRGETFLWAKTRQQLEQEKKSAVSAAKGNRTAINKNPLNTAKWVNKSESNNATLAIKSVQQYNDSLIEVHKDRVAEALAEGKPVPAAVLKDYPELVAQQQSQPQEAANGQVQEGRQAGEITPPIQGKDIPIESRGQSAPFTFTDSEYLANRYQQIVDKVKDDRANNEDLALAEEILSRPIFAEKDFKQTAKTMREVMAYANESATSSRVSNAQKNKQRLPIDQALPGYQERYEKRPTPTMMFPKSQNDVIPELPEGYISNGAFLMKTSAASAPVVNMYVGRSKTGGNHSIDTVNKILNDEQSNVPVEYVGSTDYDGSRIGIVHNPVTGETATFAADYIEYILSVSPNATLTMNQKYKAGPVIFRVEGSPIAVVMPMGANIRGLAVVDFKAPKGQLPKAAPATPASEPAPVAGGAVVQHDPTAYNNLASKVAALFGNKQGQAQAVMDLVDARAASAGLTPQQYVNSRGLSLVPNSTAGSLAQQQANKGGIEFKNTQDERKAIIHAFKSADISTLAHELAHLFRKDLALSQSAEMLQLAEKWAGVKDGKWSVDQEEKFARAFEKYLRDGQAPTTQMQQVFDKFKQWMTAVYKVLSRSALKDVKLTPQIKQVFDALLTEGGVTDNVQNEQSSVNPGATDILFQAANQPGVFDIPQTDTLWESFKFNMVNKLDPLRRAQAAATKVFGQIPDHLNAYMHEALRSSKTADVIKRFDDSVVTPFIKAAGKLLPQIEEQAYANHAPEANARLRLTTARMDLEKLIAVQKGEAKAYTQQELDVLDSVLEEQGVDIDAQQQAYYDLLHKSYGPTPAEQTLRERRLKYEEKPSGMTDQEAVEIQAKNAGNQKVQDLARQMSEMTQQKVKVMLDSGMIDPSEAAAWQKYKHYVPLKREGYEDKRGATGKGLSSMGKASQVRGGSELRATQIFANVVADYKQAVVRAEKAKTAKVLKNMIEEYPSPDLWRIETSEQKPYYDDDGNLRMYPNQEPGAHQIGVKIDGKRYLITFDEKNEAGLRIAAALKNEFTDSHPVIQFMSTVTRTLAMMNTTLSPEFLVSNLPRDIQTAMFNMGDTALTGKQSDVLKNIYASAKGIRAAMKGDLSSPHAQAWDSYLKNGGKVAWISGHGTPEATAKSIQRRIDMLTKDDTLHFSMKKISEIAGVLEDWNTIIENATRLSFYKTAVDSGALTPQQAALAAKELTTNFEAKGAWSPLLNSLYMFANAGIQGSARMVQAAAKSPQTRKMMLGAVGMAFVLDMMNRAVGGDDDDDGMPLYDKIPDNVKERNILLMNPFSETGQPFKLPAPWGFNVLWVIGSEMGRMVTGKKEIDPAAVAGKVMMAALNAFNPLQAATLAQTIAPTLAKPFVQVAENKNAFGAPLAPANMPTDKVPSPDNQLYWRSANPASKWITKELSALTGGDAIQGGAVDISPATLDTFWNTMAGAVGKFAADVATLPSKTMAGDAKLTDVPFLRRFYGVNTESVGVTTYMENSKEVFTLSEKLKSKDISPEAKAEIRQDPRIKLLGSANFAESQLRALRKQRRLDTNEDHLKIIDERMKKVYDQFNTQYNRKTLQ